VHKLMIEAAINELASKEENPNVPYGPDEVAQDVIACARAGAAIVHFHAREAKTGNQLRLSHETYIEIYRAVQKESDVILYPGYPPGHTSGWSKEDRISHILKMANEPSIRVELATLDVGSVNTGRYDRHAHQFMKTGGAYINTHADLIYFIEALSSHGIHFNLGLRDPGHMRHILAYMDMGLVKAPLSLKLFFAGDDPYGMPPTAKGLQTYLNSFPAGIEVHWFMTTVYGAPHMRMNMLAAAMGGHIRTGLGENAMLNGHRLTNSQMVELAVDLTHGVGRDVATPAEARQMMGMVA